MIDTFAGGHVVSGVSAQNVAFGIISGITRDPKGNLVFCDSSTNVIRRVNADGTIQTIAGTGIPGFGGDDGAATAALLRGPSFAKYDVAGNLYFADTGNFRIRRIDISGNITTVAGTGIQGLLGTGGAALSAQIYFVTDLVVDSAGYIYFSEYAQPLLRRITPSGQVEVFAGCATCGDVDGAPATQSSIESVTALALDSRGNSYLANSNGAQGHVYRISPDGIIHHFAGFGQSQAGPPYGNGGPAIAAPPGKFLALSADPAGNVYTEESVPLGCGCVVVLRIGTDGNINLIAGDSTGLDASTDGPALQTLLTGGGASSLSAFGGILTFADYKAIREITTQAMIQTIAGGQPQRAPDGTAAQSAWFIQPRTIAFDHAGALYVGEACSIRKIDSTGVLSTVAGTGLCSYTTPSGSALTAVFNGVSSIAFDSHNQLYFADLLGGIYEISAGTITQVANIIPGFSMKLAIDSQDRLYFANPINFGQILPGNPPQSVESTQGFSLDAIAMAIDSADYVYVCCDLTNGTYIVKYAPNLLGSPTSIPSNLVMGTESGMAFDSSSILWQGQPAFGFDKGTVPFGGACCSGSYGDGGPVESADTQPWSFVFAPNGDLYFLDAPVGRIRRIHGSPPTVAPAISAGGIVNAASLAGGAIAPGELISIFGSSFGPPGLDVASTLNNVIPKALNIVHVDFYVYSYFPIQGAITARTENQINVFVPYEIANATSIQVTVDVDGVSSAAVTVPVAPSAFGLSTADSSGTGQGAIFNQDGTYNSHSNPAPRGSIVTLFGTGEGVTTPALPDGALVISTPYSTTQAHVSVKFGDQSAEIQYAGAAPFLPTGVFQINATIPTGAAPGDVPITVSIGGISTTRTVTVAVQ